MATTATASCTTDHGAAHGLAQRVEPAVEREQLGWCCRKRAVSSTARPRASPNTTPIASAAHGPAVERAERDGDEDGGGHDVGGDAGADLPAEAAPVHPGAVPAEPVLVDLALEERRCRTRARRCRPRRRAPRPRRRSRADAVEPWRRAPTPPPARAAITAPSVAPPTTAPSTNQRGGGAVAVAARRLADRGELREHRLPARRPGGAHGGGQRHDHAEHEDGGFHPGHATRGRLPAGEVSGPGCHRPDCARERMTSSWCGSASGRPARRSWCWRSPATSTPRRPPPVPSTTSSSSPGASRLASIDGDPSSMPSRCGRTSCSKTA